MEDKELLSIAKQTADILEESKCGIDDVIRVIRMLCVRVKELNDKAIKMSEDKQ